MLEINKWQRSISKKIIPHRLTMVNAKMKKKKIRLYNRLQLIEIWVRLLFQLPSANIIEGENEESLEDKRISITGYTGKNE